MGHGISKRLFMGMARNLETSEVCETTLEICDSWWQGYHGVAWHLVWNNSHFQEWNCNSESSHPNGSESVWSDARLQMDFYNHEFTNSTLKVDILEVKINRLIEKDEIIWCPSTSGVFTSRSAYRVLRRPGSDGTILYRGVGPHTNIAFWCGKYALTYSIGRCYRLLSVAFAINLQKIREAYFLNAPILKNYGVKFKEQKGT